MVPRMDELLKNLRATGVTVIHAPSGCMAAYANDPARLRVANIPKAARRTTSINGATQFRVKKEYVTRWISRTAAKTIPLKSMPRGLRLSEGERAQPCAPWKQQHAGLSIDSATDFISDRGDEIWSLLKHKKLKNVILAGVHTNMCVLGRPFGLRQLSKNGVNVVLMRDLTDSMYNPKLWPFVSHLEGNALIISHIERHVCPTVTSDHFLGGHPFRFEPVSSKH